MLRHTRNMDMFLRGIEFRGVRQMVARNFGEVTNLEMTDFVACLGAQALRFLVCL